MLYHHEPPRRNHPRSGHGGGHGPGRVVRVGRVDQHEVEALTRGRQGGKEADDVPHDELGSVEPASSDVGPKRLRDESVPLDEQDTGGAPAQRFEAEGPGPRAGVEHPRSEAAVGEDREQGLADPVRAGPNGPARRHEELSAPGHARDDADGADPGTSAVAGLGATGRQNSSLAVSAPPSPQTYGATESRTADRPVASRGSAACSRMIR